MSQPTENFEPKTRVNGPLADSDTEIAGYNTKNLRGGFIRKVYLILLSQLLVTTLAVVIVYTNPSIQRFQKTNYWLLIICVVISICSIYALGCYKSLARSVPTNYLILSVFTIAESYIVSAVVALSDEKSVLIAVVLTTAIVLALTIYAFTTDTDFTLLGGLLFILGAALIMGGILAFFIRDRVFSLVISVIATIIFGIYLIYDTQLIIGNKENKFNIDDYCFAAVSLYIDIISIFLNVLSIISNK